MATVTKLGLLQDPVDFDASTPATATAGVDAAVLFAMVVKNWYVQNNTNQDLYIDYDQPATPGATRVFANGGVFSNNSVVQTIHIYSQVDAAINGTVAGGIVVKGWR